MKINLIGLLLCLLCVYACKKLETPNSDDPVITDPNYLNDTITIHITTKNATFCLYPHAAINIKPPKDTINTFKEIKWLPWGDTASSKIIAKPGKYAVCIWPFKGKVDTIPFTVEQCGTITPNTVTFYVPNSFTPNNDGINDTWAPKGTGIVSIYIEVRNDNGIVVFSSTALNQPWDGVWKGTNNPGPAGLYTYYIEYTDINGVFKKVAGSLELQR